MNEIKLIGKIIIQFSIKVVTGLRIGGTETGLKIGGVDQPLIRTGNDVPYIPGSSLKGKMRSLIEKTDKNLKSSDFTNGLHICKGDQKGQEDPICDICKIWGTLPPKDVEFALTRLYVRDIPLQNEQDKNKCIEIKTETAINRLNSQATGLRTFDRIAPGTIFSPGEIIFNVFEKEYNRLLQNVFKSMSLVENDYLGSSGSRGYGKITFENIKVWCNTNDDYQNGTLSTSPIDEAKNISELLQPNKKLNEKLNEKLRLNKSV